MIYYGAIVTIATAFVSGITVYFVKTKKYFQYQIEELKNTLDATYAKLNHLEDYCSALKKNGIINMITSKTGRGFVHGYMIIPDNHLYRLKFYNYEFRRTTDWRECIILRTPNLNISKYANCDYIKHNEILQLLNRSYQKTDKDDDNNKNDFDFVIRLFMYEAEIDFVSHIYAIVTKTYDIASSGNDECDMKDFINILINPNKNEYCIHHHDNSFYSHTDDNRKIIMNYYASNILERLNAKFI